MALAERNTMKVELKRFPRDVREKLKKEVDLIPWQALAREFSVDSYYGIEPEKLDGIPNLFDSSFGEFQKDVKVQVESLKKMRSQGIQAVRGKSKVGLNNYFYRFWLIGQRRPDGLYDIVFAHIARQEESDFFLRMKNLMATFLTVVPARTPFSERVLQYLLDGIFGRNEDEEPSPPTNQQPQESLGLTQQLGENLIEYEMVEDLIERGLLGENEDGKLRLQLI